MSAFALLLFLLPAQYFSLFVIQLAPPLILHSHSIHTIHTFCQRIVNFNSSRQNKTNSNTSKLVGDSTTKLLDNRENIFFEIVYICRGAAESQICSNKKSHNFAI